MPWKRRTARESSDPYYDIVQDFDLIVASFQSQYGIRLSKELKGMKWNEFKALLVGISPETPLGRVVSIRAEEDKEVLKHFTKDQRRIRSEWRNRKAAQMTKEKVKDAIEQMKQAFIAAFAETR